MAEGVVEALSWAASLDDVYTAHHVAATLVNLTADKAIAGMLLRDGIVELVLRIAVQESESINYSIALIVQNLTAQRHRGVRACPCRKHATRPVSQGYVSHRNSLYEAAALR